MYAPRIEFTPCSTLIDTELEDTCSNISILARVMTCDTREGWGLKYKDLYRQVVTSKANKKNWTGEFSRKQWKSIAYTGSKKFFTPESPTGKIELRFSLIRGMWWWADDDATWTKVQSGRSSTEVRQIILFPISAILQLMDKIENGLGEWKVGDAVIPENLEFGCRIIHCATRNGIRFHPEHCELVVWFDNPLKEPYNMVEPANLWEKWLTIIQNEIITILTRCTREAF